MQLRGGSRGGASAATAAAAAWPAHHHLVGHPAADRQVEQQRQVIQQQDDNEEALQPPQLQFIYRLVLRPAARACLWWSQWCVCRVIVSAGARSRMLYCCCMSAQRPSGARHESRYTKYDIICSVPMVLATCELWSVLPDDCIGKARIEGGAGSLLLRRHLVDRQPQQPSSRPRQLHRHSAADLIACRHKRGQAGFAVKL
jgi:hypothetical protein